MATNKHAVIRYQTLDKCFRNPGRKYFIEDLVEACSNAIYEFSGNDIGIKRRQILEDIKFMESKQGWEISLLRIREGKRVYYRYEDLNFSINNKQLNALETNQLKEALLTISRFSGLPQFEWVEELITRLDNAFGLSSESRKIIEFEQNVFLKGRERISKLYEFILNEVVLNISYRSYKRSEPETFVIHPYYLKQYNNRWFLFGQNNDFDERLQVLALDRIFDTTPLNLPFKQNDFVDFQEYFDDIVGVSRAMDALCEKVVIMVNNELAPYISSKPIHGSQKEFKIDGVFTWFSFELIVNYEFESLILSFGENLALEEPYWLKEKLMHRITAMKNRYDDF